MPIRKPPFSLVLLAILAGACGGSTSKASSAISAPPASSVVATPVQVAHTSDGTVGYRTVGHGPTLLMIMGTGASMDEWPADFVDSLAQKYRVITFDNAGVGKTSPLPGISPLPGKLTISAMADQTDAFIHSLHLGKVCVLGWSLGGMVAEALAALHPTDVSKLILDATYPGNGKWTIPSASEISSLLNPKSGIQGEETEFPPDQWKEIPVYNSQMINYPRIYAASPTVTSAQSQADLAWVLGQDPAGMRVDTIKIPTLIGDGADDELTPVGNAYTLHTMIAHSKLVVYPDADTSSCSKMPPTGQRRSRRSSHDEQVCERVTTPGSTLR